MPDLCCGSTIKLDQEFRLDSTGPFVFVVGAFREQGVDLIDEDDRGKIGSCHCKQSPNKLLTLADPFGAAVGSRSEEEESSNSEWEVGQWCVVMDSDACSRER